MPWGWRSLQKTWSWGWQRKTQRRQNPVAGSPARSAPAGEDTIDVLVPLSGEEISWNAFEQALVIAERSAIALHGLHVVARPEQMTALESKLLKQEFDLRCRAAAIDGKLVVASGEVTKEVRRRRADRFDRSQPGPSAAADRSKSSGLVSSHCCARRPGRRWSHPAIHQTWPGCCWPSTAARPACVPSIS